MDSGTNALVYGRIRIWSANFAKDKASTSSISPTTGNFEGLRNAVFWLEICNAWHLQFSIISSSANSAAGSY